MSFSGPQSVPKDDSSNSEGPSPARRHRPSKQQQLDRLNQVPERKAQSKTEDCIVVEVEVEKSSSSKPPRQRKTPRQRKSLTKKHTTGNEKNKALRSFLKVTRQPRDRVQLGGKNYLESESESSSPKPSSPESSPELRRKASKENNSPAPDLPPAYDPSRSSTPTPRKPRRTQGQDKVKEIPHSALPVVQLAAKSPKEQATQSKSNRPLESEYVEKQSSVESDEPLIPQLLKKRKSPAKQSTPNKRWQGTRAEVCPDLSTASIDQGEPLISESDETSEVPTSPEFKMAPSYRNQNRRQNRTGVVDHDIFEGLPVRQWRRDYVTVAPPPTQDSTTSQNDIWAVELPHGMPKDSHLLPQHSQDLLRAARSGRIYKRPAPAEEEEADAEAILGDKPEKKEDDPKDKGFTAKAWKPIPRHMEGPDIEYLAKKRKGLVPMKAKPAPVVATLTKTTVKRIDAAGNEYVQDVVVPHGQKVEGEVIAQTVIPDPNSSADPFAVQPTPMKRKSGGSKKKLKGPGRGRKKKQQVAPTSVPKTAPVDGTVSSGAPTEGVVGPDGVKTEADANATQTETQTQNEDTEMGDGSMANSDDDEGDEGEEGEDGDDDEGSDAQNSPSKPPRSSSPSIGSMPAIKSVPNLAPPDTIMGGTELAGPSRILTEHEKMEKKFGSPLKTVALTASTLTSPLESPTVASANGSFSAPGHQSPMAATADLDPSNLDEAMKQETAESAPTTLPPPPPEPTIDEAQAAVETLQEEEEEEEMLLDIVDNAENAQIGGPEMNTPAPQPEVIVAAAPSEAVEVPKEEETVVELPKEEKGLEEPAPEAEAEADDDDDYPDLLGGLERSLEKK